jgi:hypothetical protein
MALDQKEERAKILKYIRENKGNWQGLQKKDIVAEVMQHFNFGSARLTSKIIDELAADIEFAENTYTPNNGNDQMKERHITAIENIVDELKILNDNVAIVANCLLKNMDVALETPEQKPDENSGEEKKSKK